MGAIVEKFADDKGLALSENISRLRFILLQLVKRDSGQVLARRAG